MGTIRKHALSAIVALVLLGARGVMAAPFVWIGSGFPTWPTLNLTLSSSTNQVVQGTFIVSGASAGFASAVPTLNTYALILLVAAMGAAGLASLRNPGRVE